MGVKTFLDFACCTKKMNTSEDTQRLIAKDKEEHPNCEHSVSTSKSCWQINGKMECETIHRVLRLCPGDTRGPCEILRNTLKSEGGVPESGSYRYGPSRENPSDVRFDEQFKDIHRMIESFGGLFPGSGLGGGSGSTPSFRFPGELPPRPNEGAPPPSGGPPRDQARQGQPSREVTEV